MWLVADIKVEIGSTWTLLRNCATPDFEEGSLVKPGHVKDGSGPASVPGRHGVGRTVRFDIVTMPI